jgi:signal transduction histidine kinase
LVVYTISHQVRNPINSVLYLLNDLMNEIKLDQEYVEKYILPVTNYFEIIFLKLNDVQDWYDFQDEKF